MAKSMYNQALIVVAEDLFKFAKGEIEEVDLIGFKALSEARAIAKGKGKTPRKSWADGGNVTEGGTILAVGQSYGAINSHTLATGDVLFTMGYRGNFFISAALKLTTKKVEGPAKGPIVTIADIMSKISSK